MAEANCLGTCRAAHALWWLAHTACLAVAHTHNAGMHGARNAVVVLGVQLWWLISCK